jgi:hypothetical protein
MSWKKVSMLSFFQAINQDTWDFYLNTHVKVVFTSHFRFKGLDKPHETSLRFSHVSRVSSENSYIWKGKV